MSGLYFGDFAYTYRIKLKIPLAVSAKYLPCAPNIYGVIFSWSYNYSSITLGLFIAILAYFETRILFTVLWWAWILCKSCPVMQSQTYKDPLWPEKIGKGNFSKYLLHNKSIHHERNTVSTFSLASLLLLLVYSQILIMLQQFLH